MGARLTAFERSRAHVIRRAWNSLNDASITQLELVAVDSTQQRAAVRGWRGFQGIFVQVLHPTRSFTVESQCASTALMSRAGPPRLLAKERRNWWANVMTQGAYRKK